VFCNFPDDAGITSESDDEVAAFRSSRRQDAVEVGDEMSAATHSAVNAAMAVCDGESQAHPEGLEEGASLRKAGAESVAIFASQQGAARTRSDVLESKVRYGAISKKDESSVFATPLQDSGAACCGDGVVFAFDESAGPTGRSRFSSTLVRIMKVLWKPFERLLGRASKRSG
jgi:hypothetical protein